MRSARGFRLAAAGALVASMVVGLGPSRLGFGVDPAGAAATTTVAFWSMDEPPGATTLIDSSGNGHHGSIGAEVQTGTLVMGSTAHRFPDGPPSAPPARPEHLERIPDSPLLDPGTSDYAVTIRMRQTRPYGNVVQKGQNATPGGYWKFESPNGNITCLFKGATGAQRAIVSPISIQDGLWHVVRCERTSAGLRMWIDGVSISFLAGSTGSISNSRDVSIAGKYSCDQITITCDYFAGDIDYIRIEKGSSGPPNQPPVANIDPECAGLICSLVGAGSTDSDGAIQTWAWNFGDGATGSGKDVSHTYSTPGTYNVSLLVTYDRGATDTENVTVTVAPDSGAISFVGGDSSNVNATSHTVVVPSNVLPGDGLLLFHTQNNSATISEPTQVTGWTGLDTVAGGYARTRVWKKVASPGDAGATVRVNLSLQAKANLMVVAYRGTSPSDPVSAFARIADTVSTTDHPTPFVTPPTPGSWVVSYWMHGDSTTTVLTAPAGVTSRGTGTQTGSGRVTTLLADSNSVVPAAPYGGLVATAPTASTTSSAWSIALRPGVVTNNSPTASITSSCDNLDCDFGAIANDSDGEIASIDWEFGDGGTATGASAAHSYLSSDTYTVSLTVTDDDNASTTVTQSLTVAANVAPMASFTTSCVDSTCSFDGSSSSDSDGTVDAFAWDFGDGGSSTEANPSYVYPIDGTSTVMLTVTDDDGEVGSTSTSVTVPVPNVAPTASFTTSCVDSACSFDGSGSSDSDGTVDAFAWDFGDGGSSTEANPSYVYPIDGTYTVMLTVTDNDGEIGSTTTSVTVPVPNLPPTAAFSSDCTQLACSFDSSGSSDADGTIDVYAWDFGDGNTSSATNPTHVFVTGGSYTVTLTVTDNDLAATSTSTTVTVTAAPVDVIAFVGAASSNANATTHTVQIPSSVQAGDGLLLFLAENTTATISTPAGWTIVGTVTDDGATTRVWRKVATGGDAGSNVSVNLSAISKAGFTVAAYRGTSTVDPVAAFSGVGVAGSSTVRTTPIVAVTNPQSWVVSYWSHKDSASNALTPPVGVTVRASGTQTSGGRVTTLLADSGALVPVGDAGGLIATAPNAGTAATAWTIVLAPA